MKGWGRGRREEKKNRAAQFKHIRTKIENTDCMVWTEKKNASETKDNSGCSNARSGEPFQLELEKVNRFHVVKFKQ